VHADCVFREIKIKNRICTSVADLDPVKSGPFWSDPNPVSDVWAGTGTEATKIETFEPFFVLRS
jgi:hypothetical protein